MDGYAAGLRHSGGARSGLGYFVRTNIGGIYRDFEHTAMTITSGAANGAESAFRVGDTQSYIDTNLINFLDTNQTNYRAIMQLSTGTPPRQSLSILAPSGAFNVFTATGTNTYPISNSASYLDLVPITYDITSNGDIHLNFATGYLGGASPTGTVNIGTGGDRSINFGDVLGTGSEPGILIDGTFADVNMRTYGEGNITIGNSNATGSLSLGGTTLNINAINGINIGTETGPSNSGVYIGSWTGNNTVNIGNAVAGEVIAMNGGNLVNSNPAGPAMPATAYNGSLAYGWLPITYNGNAGYILYAY